MDECTTIRIDGRAWLDHDDVYTAILTALRPHVKPHGHNLDALWETVTSQTMDVRAPYHIRVDGFTKMGAEAGRTVLGIARVFSNARATRRINASFEIEP
ncbi:MAG: hypothetical protein NVSMB64_05850 [Candidatus Velthaea sp.]